MNAAPSPENGRLRLLQPLRALSSAQRFALQRMYGMHAPVAESRTGSDAFEIRHDVSLGDALMTLDGRLSMLRSVLMLAQSELDSDSLHVAALSACQVLAEEAGGALCVLAEAVFEHCANGVVASRETHHER